MLNIMLGVAAVLVWVGAFGWYFHRDIRSAWHAYRTRWTN
jgi:hypothetical protein